MSSRNLDYLLSPSSIAVIGASDRPQSIGATVMRNLLGGGFKRPIWPVNLRRDTVAGLRAYRTVAELPHTPDLAVICTPAPGVPGLIRALGERGTRAAVIISSGFNAPAPEGGTLKDALLAAAQPYDLRILGPNCVGLLLPHIGLNASFAHTHALPGNLAFIAQSGALTTAMLDWARTVQVGFSCFVSLGNGLDVDFGDLLGKLSHDPRTRAILLYIESISDARKIMEIGRAAAGHKPIMVVKAGRGAQGARAAASHTGALAGADEVYDAAFRRAGMLRVDTTRQLFDAAETLARMKPLHGERLTIVSNGGGPAVMAIDALTAREGAMAELSSQTIERLDAVLPANWPRANPVDIIGDAPVQRYIDALTAVLDDPGTDAVLLIHCPTAIVPPEDIAKACIPVLTNARRPVLTCWMGGAGVRAARTVCAEAGIPTYSTPEEAIDAFLQAVNFRRNQRQLLELAPMPSGAHSPRANLARTIMQTALIEHRELLTEPEAKSVLAAYRIPVVETRIAANPADACRIASEIGYPVVLKILSPDITHKSDVGGVALDIADEAQLLSVAEEMLLRCRQRRPEARIAGFTVQPMVRRPGARELIVGIATDRTFGPAILFGQGGVDVEIIADRAIALPPLNANLAAELISRTRVRRLLAAHRNRPAVNMDALRQTLVQVSQLAVELPEVAELDINPLLADANGVLALDARIRVRDAGPTQA